MRELPTGVEADSRNGLADTRRERNIQTKESADPVGRIGPTGISEADQRQSRMSAGRHRHFWRDKASRKKAKMQLTRLDSLIDTAIHPRLGEQHKEASARVPAGRPEFLAPRRNNFRGKGLFSNFVESMFSRKSNIPKRLRVRGWHSGVAVCPRGLPGVIGLPPERLPLRDLIEAIPLLRATADYAYPDVRTNRGPLLRGKLRLRPKREIYYA